MVSAPLIVVLFSPAMSPVSAGILHSQPGDAPERAGGCSRPLEGEDLLILVNKTAEHSLAEGWMPEDLVRLDSALTIPGRSASLRREAARAFADLVDAAATDRGFDIRVRSGFRSFSTQRRVFRSKVRKYGEARARRLSAVAGHSQHQLGTTVDVSVPRFGWKFTQRLGVSPEGKWLDGNAYRYGFVLSYPRGQEELTGYAYEPWHYRYVGADAAEEMRSADLVLEEYLRRCDRCDAALRCPR